jgi:hypothetical protein
LILKKTPFKLLFNNYAGRSSACIAKQECTLMHAKFCYIQHFILLATFCALAACSDSSTTEKSTIDIVEEVFFPYIQNSTLYNFNPDTGSSEKLVESNKFLMISLDIDESEAASLPGTDTTYLDQTSLPEHIVYVEDQSLRLYDLHTRHNHILTSFTATTDQDNDEYICDLKPAITVDERNLAENEILFKNDTSVYIKTSTTETCTGSPSSFRYFEIKIKESFTETFRIRRTRLLPHEHFHTHQHEHQYDHDNDHNGDHDHAKNDHPSDPENGDLHDSDGHQIEQDPNNPELPKYPNEAPHDHSHNDTYPDKLHDHSHGLNIKDRKYHEHKHEHEHDFRYILMDEHELEEDPAVSPEELKEKVHKVHNNPINQITEIETHPVLEGKKHVIDEALMYAGNPIVDVRNKRFGYLGLNNSDPESAEPYYKFYEYIENGDEKIELWTITNSEFSIQPEDHSGAIDRNFSDAVMIEFNWKMVKWNIVDLFDDDKNTERKSSINNPLFSRSHAPEDIYNSAIYSINKSQNTIAIYEAIDSVVVDTVTNEESIQEIKMLYTVSTDGTQSLINTFIDDTMQLVFFTLFPNNLIAFKEFSNNSGRLSAAITYTGLGDTLEGSIESTLSPISDSTRAIIYPGDTLGMSVQDDSNPNWNASYFKSDLTPARLINDIENATWGRIFDRRPISNNLEYSPIILQSETAVTPDLNSSATALFEPNIYLLNTEDNEWKGKLLGTVPTTVSFAYDAIIHNDLFAQITIEETPTLPKTLKTYYFNPDDPTTEMRLMFEEVFNE